MVQGMNKTGKILIVDDTPKNIQIVASILKDKNYSLSFASSGKKAIELCSKNIFDLILFQTLSRTGVDCQQHQKTVMILSYHNFRHILFIVLKQTQAIVDKLKFVFLLNVFCIFICLPPHKVYPQNPLENSFLE